MFSELVFTSLSFVVKTINYIIFTGPDFFAHANAKYSLSLCLSDKDKDIIKEG
jgi:hypothetical protein